MEETDDLRVEGMGLMGLLQFEFELMGLLAQRALLAAQRSGDGSK